MSKRNRRVGLSVSGVVAGAVVLASHGAVAGQIGSGVNARASTAVAVNGQIGSGIDALQEQGS